MPIMESRHQEKVHPAIAEKSKNQIEAVDTFQHNLRGTVLIVKTLQCGQSRAYADTVYESLLFCYCPNSLTTGAPSVRWLKKEEAKALAKIFVHGWEQETPNRSCYLDFIKPEYDTKICPEEPYHANLKADGRAPVWHVRVVVPFND